MRSHKLLLRSFPEPGGRCRVPRGSFAPNAEKAVSIRFGVVRRTEGGPLLLVNGKRRHTTANIEVDSYGRDQFDAYTLNSANAAVNGGTGDPRPLNYYDGYLQATQLTSNLDVKRNFDVGPAGPLNVAYGLEYRRDSCRIGAGIPISYSYLLREWRRPVVSRLQTDQCGHALSACRHRLRRAGCPANRSVAPRYRDDGDNSTTIPAYFDSIIGVKPITNLDVSYQLAHYVRGIFSF